MIEQIINIITQNTIFNILSIFGIFLIFLSFISKCRKNYMLLNIDIDAHIRNFACFELPRYEFPKDNEIITLSKKIDIINVVCMMVDDHHKSLLSKSLITQAEIDKQKIDFINNLKHNILPLLFTIKNQLRLSRFGIYYAIKLGFYNLLELNTCNIGGFNYEFDVSCRLS